MVRAYDDYGNIVDMVIEYERQIRADVLKGCILDNGEYCWQRCVALEHCKECKSLGNGRVDFYESFE